jgi:hypothetical protein
MYRYFYEDKVLMIEIVVDPTNTVVRRATEEDKKNYPPHAAPKQHDAGKHEDKKK